MSCTVSSALQTKMGLRSLMFFRMLDPTRDTVSHIVGGWAQVRRQGSEIS